MIVPDDYQFEYSQNYYKIGRHGMLFLWVIDEWRRTTATQAEVITRDRRQSALQNRRQKRDAR